MPLYVKNDNLVELKQKEKLKIHEDVEIEFCSDECLLRQIDANFELVRNGQTKDSIGAFLGDKELLVNIYGTNRTCEHPLGIQHNLKTKRELWEKLVNKDHPNLMQVNSLCNCMARVQIVDGVPLMDIGTTPAWQKISTYNKSILLRSKNIAFESWQKWMRDLCLGLDYLHKNGIAHGDPYPFNIIIKEDSAIWIDFGNISDDGLQIYSDIWAFLVYTVLYSYNYCEKISLEIVDDIFSAINTYSSDNILEQLSIVFSKKRDDLRNNDKKEVSEKIFSLINEVDILSRNGEFYKVGRKTILLGLNNYYFSFLYWMKEALDKNEYLKLVDSRHRMIENETRRLMVPKDYIKILQSDHNNEINALQSSFREEMVQLNTKHTEEINSLKMKYEKEIENINNSINIAKQLHQEENQKYILDNKKITEEFNLFKLNYVEEFKEMDNNFYDLRNNLEDVKNQLTTLNSLKSYKISKFLRIAKSEFGSGSLINGFKFLSRVFAYIGGKRGILEKYNINDPLYNAIENLSKSMSKTNSSFELGDSFEDAKNDVVEIRKGKNCIAGSKKRVAYFTNQLLDWFDYRPRYGGGERYCINLSNLLSENGLEVDIYQIAPKPFEGDYCGYHVKAISHGNFYSEFNIDGANAFYNISLNYDYVIYNMPELSAGRMRLDAISICHGIWFDHNNYGPMYEFRQRKWFKALHRAFANPHRIVSVDTNSVNVIRSFWPELSTKMTFIPNFVDHNNFFPDKSKRDNQKLRILFPRRSQINRGSRILSDILQNVPYNVEFYWVGEGDDYDTQIILDICKRDRRLHYEKASFDEMPKWYQMVDIVVIPTIACEGTSLSCIEALASGCATIATNVGGLTDIIQDGINGRSVDPNPIAISRAINQLIENKELLEKYQKTGYESSFAFSIKKWREKWSDVLYEEGWLENRKKFEKIEKINKDKNKDQDQDQDLNVVIVTRNAYHGGVEALIKLESEKLNAQVIVAGGINNPTNTCPFNYIYVSTYEELLEKLKNYDVILYHWPLDWAVQAISDSGISSVEFVHRTDTSECDKKVPTIVATHSHYIKDYIKENYDLYAKIVPNVVDTERFKPRSFKKEKVIGALTSYYSTKGIDIFLDAWSMINDKYNDYKVKFYGSGNDLEIFKNRANELNLNIEFNDALSDPTIGYNELMLYITASRVEGLPISVLESLASNVPVIASDIEGHSVINRMAKENGLKEPLILFETENPKDLAEKIDNFLSSYYENQVNVREVIEKIFNPNLHIDGIKEQLNEAYRIGGNKKNKQICIIDEILDTGMISPSQYEQGFYLINTVNDGEVSVNYERLSFEEDKVISEHNNFVCYRYKIINNPQKISCLIYCENENIADVFLQFNWNDNNGKLSKMIGSGRYIDKYSNKMYMIQSVPEELTDCNGYLEVIIRPNPQQNVIIKGIHIKAWNFMG